MSEFQSEIKAIELSRRAGQPFVTLAGQPTSSRCRSSVPLTDNFGRVHRALRVSVTDRCNIRCQYCMPEQATFMDSDRLLSLDEIARFVRALATLGIRSVRITGGEPLMRPNLHLLFAQLRDIEGLNDLALTTNGMLLTEQLEQLVAAGLKRVNISLDTLQEATFKRLSRRDGLDRVLAGIDAAVSHPSLTVKLNALVMRDVNLSECLELVAFARERGLVIRFIEFMPLDADRAWSRQQMVSGDELRRLIGQHVGRLQPIRSDDPARPASDYRFDDGRGGVGFIDSVSQPFCSSCDRLRLTADGKLRNCLFGQQEWDVRPWLRQNHQVKDTADQHDELANLLRDCLAAKRAAHGIDASDFQPPERAMYQIGG